MRAPPKDVLRWSRACKTSEDNNNTGDMNMKTNDLNQLREDLTKFGLNPQEWTLRRLPAQRYLVSHIKDRGFYFLGEVQRRGLLPRWQDLRLMSL